jgi:hypothetical protein
MRTKTMLKLAALCLTASLGLTGCSSSKNKGDAGEPDFSGNVGDMTGPNADAADGGGEEDFEDFVIGLIQTQTAETTSPTAIDGKMFTDSMDPSKFSVLF